MTLSQHRLTPTGSAQPNLTLLSSAWPGTTQPSGSYWVKELTLNLGASRYTSPNCFFIKLTVSMKKPFLLPCFPSLSSSSSSSYASSVSLIRLRSRTEQSFGALRWRGAGLKWRFVLLCVCACVPCEKAPFTGGSRRARGDRWRGRDGRCEVMTSVVLRFSEVCKGIAFFWQMKRCVFQVLRQRHPFHHYRGKQSAYCVERRVLGSCFPLILECTNSLTRVSVTSSSPVKLSMTFSWNVWFRVMRMCRPRLIYSTI